MLQRMPCAPFRAKSPAAAWAVHERAFMLACHIICRAGEPLPDDVRGGNFFLQSTVRYAHSKAYVLEELHAHGFSFGGEAQSGYFEHETVEMRKELQATAFGHVVIAQRLPP